jgi:hypothetical protein
VKAQLAAFPQGSDATHRAVFFTATSGGVVERSGLCLWVHTIAEVDERHVAWEPRRKPASELGLARRPARERVSEAEPRRLSRGISGGREAHVPSASEERAERTRRWKALRVWKAVVMVLPSLEGSLVLLGCSGLGRGGRVVRQEASVTRSRGLRTD